MMRRSGARPVPAAEIMWILRVNDGGEPRSLRVPPGAVRTVGRGARADFVVSDTLMSRVHCRLSASGRQLVVEDLDSTNGTFVNGARVDIVGLEEGDRVRLGRAELIVRSEEARSDGDGDVPRGSARE